MHCQVSQCLLAFSLCRLSGFENSMFGWKSRLYPTIKKLIKNRDDDIEVVQFGKDTLLVLKNSVTLILSRLRAALKGFSGPSQTPCTHARFTPGLESRGFHRSHYLLGQSDEKLKLGLV